MWVIPKSLSSSFPSARVGADSTEDSPRQSHLDQFAQSFVWRGKPFVSSTWLLRWKRVPWMLALFSLTSTMSPTRFSKDYARWLKSVTLLSLRVFPASRGRRPASDKEPRTSDGSGTESLGSFAWFDPESCSLRTCQASLTEDSDMSSLPLPKSGSLRNGRLYERPPLALRIDGRDSSFLEYPTPAASTYGRNKGGQNPEGPERPSLETWAKTWPTPTAKIGEDSQTHRSGNRTKELLLTGQAAAFRQAPTATGPESPGHSGLPSPGKKSNEWETPTTGPNTKSEKAMRRFRDGGQSSTPGLAQQAAGVVSMKNAKKRLNPLFVAWLMGWHWLIPEWIFSECSEMESSRNKQSSPTENS